MTPETLFALADARGLTYERMASSTKPQWPLEDIALAMADMYPVNERARCYAAWAWRWSRDKEQYQELWAGLVIATAERSLRERWPRKICGEYYIEKLVDLAILEEHFWWLLRAKDLYAGMLGVDQMIWERRYSRRYEAVRQQIEAWVGQVRSHMIARMRGEDQTAVACA